MKIKLILFDLDGVLIRAKDIHYKALNLALGDKFAISLEDHHGRFDGLPTRKKLNTLSKEKGLSLSEHDIIWKKKQEITLELFLTELNFDKRLNSVIQSLKEDYGLLIGCCSNSIRRTIYTALSKTGIIQYFDLILSADDVYQPKPHPEIYWKAMSILNCLPEETLIIEDNPHGLLSAFRSNANVLRVTDPNDVTTEKIMNAINNEKIKEMKTAWCNKKLNVLIPMAGAGTRFQQSGYTFPKPLIEVHGKPMIQVVVDNLNLDANYIFIVQKEHREKYNLDALLKLIAKNCQIIEVNGLTEGAACTALMAKDIINNAAPLFFANSDQFVEWESAEFMYQMQESGADGGIVTFKSTHPKWSFAKINKQGFVTEVAEKNPISDIATVGFYYWKHGSDFVKYAEQMIQKNIRVNNEFYVCPVFNQAIEDGKKIKTHSIKKMWGLGDPESLDLFIKNFNEN